jgi:hypothetical protein
MAALAKDFLDAKEIMLYKLPSIQFVLTCVFIPPQAILAQLVEQLIRNQ